MKETLRGKLTYSNVVATLALFLVLAGGSAFAASRLHLGKNAIKSKNIAPGAVKNKNLAKNAVKEKNIANGAVSGAKVLPGSLTRSQLAPGTLAGIQVTELQSAAVPGLGETETPETGIPVPLSGNATFTPAAGKSYEILVEMKGNPVDADGGGGGHCGAEVDVFANGQYITFAEVFANQEAAVPFRVQPVGTNASALGLLEAGQPLTLSALAYTNGGCKPIAASFKATVIEFG
jgi:hypothetical protein